MDSYLQIILVVAYLSAAALAIVHALLYKRTSQSALGWIATCILFPLAGPLLYFFFGINRVSRRAKRLWRQSLPAQLRLSSTAAATDTPAKNLELPAGFSGLAAFANVATGNPLLPGNDIEILHNGEDTYPAMLDAINRATQCIYLSTYIFRADESGKQFIDALAAAQSRGVDVKVLIDGYGDLYYFPRASTRLKKRGVNLRQFLPLRLMPSSAHLNLRNHRKILTIDGQIAFTGGMNIGDHHLANNNANRHRIVDLHFRITGPVVAQLEIAFLRDWVFTTRDAVAPTAGDTNASGPAICRVITDGPDEDINKIKLSLLNAIAAARDSISIMTPYFIPPRELIGALQAAATRGVDVSIILPAQNNLFFVHRASRNMLWELLQHGVKILYRPPPFAHSKLFIVDRRYAQIGSTNLDPRSLRLNFEVAVEIHSAEFAGALGEHFEQVLRQSTATTLSEVDNRPLHTRLIDAVFWLFSPYM